MKSVRTGVVTLVATFSLMVPYSATAVANNGNSQSPQDSTTSEVTSSFAEGNKQTAEEARAIDAARIAEARGWNPATAQDRAEALQRFGELIDVLSDLYPDRYAGAWAEHGRDGATFFVKFIEDVPQGARERIRSTSLDVIARTADRSSASPLKLLKARSDPIHQAVVDSGFDSVASYVSEERSTINMLVTRPDGHEGESDEELRQRLPESARAPDVIVEFVDEPAARTHHSWGGAELLLPDPLTSDPVLECTSGFAVRATETGGISTAAHCRDDIQWYDSPDVNMYGTQLQEEHYGQFGDMEWHTTQHLELRRFYVGNTDWRNVRTVRPFDRFFTGDVYCMFGRASGDADCALVEHPDTNCTDTDHGTAYNLTAMDEVLSIPGDSGGPWFYGTAAAGTTWGNCDLGSAFSKADLVNDALPVDVGAGDRKVRGQTMYTDDRIWSYNDDYMLVMQEDGNLVIYGPDGALWSTAGDEGAPTVSGSRVVMQGDGNFVMYSPDDQALWATGTGHPGSHIIMQDDGNLVVYTEDWDPRWGSGPYD